MIKRGMAICAVLAFAGAAFADIEVDLRPATPAPYDPGEIVNVQAWFVDKDNGHPETGEDIRFRGYQLDFTASSGTLILPSLMTMETDPYDINELFPDLPKPSLIFPSGSTSPLQMTLPAGGEMLVGDLDVEVTAKGTLDVMNFEDGDVNNGAWVRFGFGIDEDDPVTTWRSYDEGGLNGGQLWMPEPASMALLAFGGLALLRRRRTT